MERIITIILLVILSVPLFGQDNLGNHIATQNITAATDGKYNIGVPGSRFATIQLTDGLYWGTLSNPSTSRLLTANSNNSIFFGFNTGLIGQENTFIGAQAGTNTGLSSPFNTFVGAFTGTANGIGMDNTFIGAHSGEGNSTGNDNTFVGMGAGNFNKTGNNNVYMGTATANYNNGSQNVVVGSLAAAFASPKFNNSVLIGYNAGVAGNLTNAVAIGHSAFVTVNNGMVLGNGTSLVGIRLSNPQYPLHVQNAYCDGFAWVNASDKNIKENFSSIEKENVLDKLMQLPIQRWNYIDDEKKNSHIGPMAQDFHKLFRVGQNETTIASVDESGVALAAIQEVTRRLQKLESQVTTQHQFTAALLEAHSSTTESPELNRRTRLLQNAPNPFHTTTTIHFQLPDDASSASITIFNSDGKQVASFNDVKNKGHITVEGNSLAPGLYYYSLIVNGKILETKKMVLTK